MDCIILLNLIWHNKAGHNIMGLREPPSTPRYGVMGKFLWNFVFFKCVLQALYIWGWRRWPLRLETTQRQPWLRLRRNSTRIWTSSAMRWFYSESLFSILNSTNRWAHATSRNQRAMPFVSSPPTSEASMKNTQATFSVLHSRIFLVNAQALKLWGPGGIWSEACDHIWISVQTVLWILNKDT